MSRALIIKNADFSVNKLGTITLEEEVPCTGITLNKSTLALSSIGSTDTLVATPTPSGTTDTVVWSTSDADVVTVSGGTVTAVGCGTATITVTCGSQSASCAVTVTHIAEYGYDLNSYYVLNNNKDFIEGGTLNNYSAIYSDNPIGDGLRAAYQYRTQSKYPIAIPNGANKININCSTYKSRVFWLDSTTPSASPAVTTALTPTDSAYVIGSRSVDIPERTGDYANLDSFVISFNIGDTISDAVMQSITVEFTA